MKLSGDYSRVAVCRRVQTTWGTDGDFITPGGKIVRVGENHTLFMMANPDKFGGSEDPDDMVYQGWIRTRGIGGRFSVDARGGMNQQQLQVLQKEVRDRCKYSDPTIEVVMDDDDVYEFTCDDFDYIERPYQIKRGLRFAAGRMAASSREVPPTPGETPIPPDHVRLYHYTQWMPEETDEQAAERLWKEGIDIGKARGSTYGEPDVVWGSTKPPGKHKVYAEFSVHKDDPRWGTGRPRTSGDVDWLNKGNIDVNFLGSIKPEDILAVHQPWHHTYRYLEENNMFPEVVNGDYDYLLDKPDSNEAKAINYIKIHHGK